MLEFIDFLLILLIYLITMGAFCLMYYLDQRAWKTALQVEMKEMMIDFKAQGNSLTTKLRRAVSAVVPDVGGEEPSMTNQLIMAVLTSPMGQDMLSKLMGGFMKPKVEEPVEETPDVEGE